MRILLTTHAFLPRSVAGVEVYTARLARALQDQGHAVRVLTAAHDLAAAPHSLRQVQVGSLDVIELVNPQLEGVLAGARDLSAIDEAISEVVREFRPDCVHAQHLLNLSTGIVDAAHAVRSIFVLTLHDYWLSCPRDGLRAKADGSLCPEVDHAVCASCLASSPHLIPPLQRFAARAARALGLGRGLHALHDHAPDLAATAADLTRRLWPVRGDGLQDELDARAGRLREQVLQADAILAPTRFAHDRAVEWGIAPSRLRVLPLGAIEGPTRPRPAGPRRRFGYLGTLAPHKGVHVLIAAFRRFPLGEATLDVFGNPALDPAYSRRLRGLAGDDTRIRFRGAIAEGGQGLALAALDALVLPSLWWENSPLTVLEALAAGVPVLASRIGGVPEVLPEGAGVLLPPGDGDALRTALADVADGRLLAGALAPLPLKSTREGAEELVALYEGLRRDRVAAP
jgi:glycosyltransferase involved in cell wall biosynthesis